MWSIQVATGKMRHAQLLSAGLLSLSIMYCVCHSAVSDTFNYRSNADCDEAFGEPVKSPDGINSATLQTEICTGFGRRSTFSIILSTKNKDKGAVFVQEGSTPPLFRWKDISNFSIEVETKENVHLSLHHFRSVNIFYSVPKNLSREIFRSDISDYRIRMEALIQQGKVDLSGGSTQEDRKNLNENTQRELDQYDRFSKWMSANNVQINQDGGD